MSELWTPQPQTELWTPEQHREWQDYVAGGRQAAQMLMERHVENPASGMSFLPMDETYPWQEPDRVLVAGNPIPVHEADATAEIVWPGFGRLLAMAGDGPEAEAAVSDSRDILQAGGNIWINTLHFADIKDIILAQKLVQNLLNETGYQPNHLLSVISHGIAEVKFSFETKQGTVPFIAIPTIGIMCDSIVKTWPRSGSSEDILGDWLKFGRAQSNKLSKLAIRGLFGITEAEETTGEEHPGGTLGTIAGSGTTTTQLGLDGRRYIHPVGEGTAELMMLPNTYVVSLIIVPHGDKPIAVFYGGPVEITDISQLHELTGGMAERTNELIPGAGLAYDPGREFERD